MSWGRIAGIGALVILFIFGKVWILRHPKSAAGIVVGAFLLILSEPAEAK